VTDSGRLPDPRVGDLFGDGWSMVARARTQLRLRRRSVRAEQGIEEPVAKLGVEDGDALAVGREDVGMAQP